MAKSTRKHSSKTPAGTQTADNPAASENQEAFAVRLRAVADNLGGVKALADAAGVFPSSAHDWFQGAEPKRDALAKIARAARVSLDWLIAGRGNYAPLRFFDLMKSQGYNEAFIAPSRTDGEPRYRLFDLSLLDPPDASTSIGEKGARYAADSRDRLFLVIVGGSGDKMAPLIRDGDLIVVASAVGTEIGAKPTTAPYMFSYQGRVIIRLVRAVGGSGSQPLRIMIGPVDRTAWPPKMAKPEHTFAGIIEDDFRVLGRVIWCGRSLLSLDVS